MAMTVINTTSSTKQYSWRNTLDALHLYYLNANLSSNEKECITDVVTARMQSRFPGPYTVVEYADPVRLKFGFKLKFANPHDELLWMLKWGQ